MISELEMRARELLAAEYKKLGTPEICIELLLKDEVPVAVVVAALSAPAAVEAVPDDVIEDRIAELVREHGSFRAASNAVGISYPYLCRLKCGYKGNPSDEVLHKLGLRQETTTTYTSLSAPPTQGAVEVVPDVSDLKAEIEDLQRELVEARETCADDYEKDAAKALRSLMKYIDHQWDEPLPAHQQADAIVEYVEDLKKVPPTQGAGVDGLWKFVEQTYDAGKTSTCERLLDGLGLPNDEPHMPLSWHINRHLAGQPKVRS